MPAHSFKIDKKDLANLYFQRKLSMFQIANYYGCTHGTIVDRFKKFGLKSRGHLGLKNPITITKNRLEKLYNQDLSVKQIANKFGFSKSGIEKKIKQFKIKTRGNKHRKHWKYKKKSFSKNLEEKAYLIGFRLGDLNIYSTNQVIIARSSTTKINQVVLFKKLFLGYGGVKITVAKRGTYEHIAYLDKSFSFLIPKQDNIPSWIKNCPRCFLAFFAGYFDAEGYVAIHKNLSVGFGGFVIQTSDKNIIFQSWKNLTKMKISCPKPQITTPAGYLNKNQIINNKNMWRLSVFDKKSVWQLLEFFECSLKHPDKRKKLNLIKDNIIKRNKMRSGGKLIDLLKPKLPQHNHQ